jgi:hypothetical protein
VFDHPFDKADKVTDFTSTADDLYISLTKEATSGKVADYGVGATNSLDAKWMNGNKANLGTGK